MIKVDIRADLEQVKRALRAMERDAVPAALARALNKTAAAVRTTATKEIRAERKGLLSKTIRDQIRIERASKARQEAAVVASGRPIPLRDYRARETLSGVTVQAGPGGRKLIRHKGNAAFIVKKIGSHVFARERSSRLPIKKLYGPSIPSTFLKDRIVNAMKERIAETFPKRMREEISYELKRKGFRG